jgi:polyhydroxybutyrate depolymerase
MNRKIQSLISVAVFTGLFAGGCAKAATPVPTAAPTTIPTNTLSPAPTLQPGDSTRSIKVGDLTREYILHIPPGIDMVQPTPVVFVFHGSFETAQGMDLMTGFNNISETNGFLVVYPSGEGMDWDVGNCCGLSAQNRPDDIAFAHQILIDLGTFASINPRRIYSTGFSAGANFSYRLACEMSDKFAAIAPVSGDLLYFPCQPQQPVSVIHEHGLTDTIVPYAGGLGGIPPDITFPSVEQSVATWAQLDGCNTVPQVEKQGIIRHSVYSSCRAGTAVELYTMDAQGHSWPSQYVMPLSKMIWEFFAAHPKP